MTTLQSHVATAADTAEAIDLLGASLEAQLDPALIFVFYGCTHDGSAVHALLRQRFPQAALIGGTSSGGLLTQRGFHGAQSIGLLCLEDSTGNYGSAAGVLGSDPAATAERLLSEALDDCDCAGELPELVWIYQAPGSEEKVLEGLRRVVGDRCPIIGGSAADDDVSGRWFQLGSAGPLADGLVVAVLFPSTPVSYAFQGGYEPTGQSGLVTRVGAAVEEREDNGGAAVRSREIVAIDGEPAAAVYDRWSGGRITAYLAAGGTILGETTMHPLAVEAGRVDGVAHYLLIHPEAVTAHGSLRTFCDVQVGERVFAMRGDRRRLIDRAGRVADEARRALDVADTRPAGAVMVYCGGCKLAVDEQIHEVAGSVRERLGDAPFIGCFTFGEQGRLMERNVHGNLMISAVVFGA